MNFGEYAKSELAAKYGIRKSTVTSGTVRTFKVGEQVMINDVPRDLLDEHPI